MNKYLAYFTVQYTDVGGNPNTCEGAIPFMAIEGDEYFIAEAIIEGIAGASYLYSEKVEP